MKKTIKEIRVNGMKVFSGSRQIGEVYQSDELWGYNSRRMEKKSGGLSGHWGMDSRKEAIDWLIETDKEYK